MSTIAQRLSVHRQRAERALTARCTIERSNGSSWATTATLRPCMVENLNAGSNLLPEPVNRQSGETLGWRISFAIGEDVQTGDRITITDSFQGAFTFPVMIAGKEISGSVDIYKQVVATAEGSAVERYDVEIERWNDTTEAYEPVGIWTVQAVLQWTSTSAVNDQGATASNRRGVMFMGTTEPVQAGDWVYGLPWGTAQITAVFDPVGTRRDVNFRLTTGA
jgi:hypothetical protein